MIMKVGFIISLHQYTFSTGSAMADWNFFFDRLLQSYWSHTLSKGGEVCFWTPPLWPTTFYKRTPAQKKKIWGCFFQKIDGFCLCIFMLNILKMDYGDSK